MSRGSAIHDAIGDHFRSCAHCRAVDPEEVRIRQAAQLRLTVPEATLKGAVPSWRGDLRGVPALAGGV